MERLVAWLWRRLQPQAGWFSLVLLGGLVLCLVTSVLAADWVPGVRVVIPAAFTGLSLGVVLAQRRTSALLAWFLITAYGAVVTIFYVAQLFRWQSAAAVRQSLALLLDRTAGWLQAVSTGGRSEETVVLALGLGMLACLLAAYLAWSSYRQYRPLNGLAVAGLALAVNGYFAGGGLQAWLLALFVAGGALLAAALHFAALEKQWVVAGTDYSGQIRLELLLAAGGVALGLLLVAFLLPAVPLNALARAFQQTGPVEAVEDTLERAFAGARPPDSSGGLTGGGTAGGGLLPRAFLLGNAPELQTTVVMTAVVQGELGAHWRAISYDIYTGRGWARSEEHTEVYAAGEMLPLPEVQAGRIITQQVHWLLDERLVRYSMGLPLRFDQEVTAAWRGLEDLVRVTGRGEPRYTVTSRLATDDPQVLRQAQLEEVPPAVLARYTALPEGMPARVDELAAQITSGTTTPYDAAKAIEAFLRQYPYSLDVPPPPTGRDPVDFFLFELQQGYCDYYASAMVVLARAVGLPARMVIGYRAQSPGENGVQTIYHINAHSWAEIYLGDYGWVSFEPTAAYPADTPTQAAAATRVAGTLLPTPPPIPVTQPARSLNWLAGLGLLLLLVGVFVWLWWRRHRPAASGVLWAYGQLQRAASRLGLALPPSQTPAEFAAAFHDRLRSLRRQRVLAWLLGSETEGATEIVERFVARQYGARKPGRQEEAAVDRAYRRMHGRLWLVGWLYRLFGGF